jgi:SsrA-binding protein
MRDLIKNRKATFNYEILETFDAGLILCGWEVKSILNGDCSLGEGFISFKNNELYLKQTHISLYKNMDKFSEQNETRDRKLLLNKSEVRKIKKKIEEKGLTVIPLKIFYSDTKKIKISIGVARGKKLHDKRDSLKKKQTEREMKRELKRF